MTGGRSRTLQMWPKTSVNQRLGLPSPPNTTTSYHIQDNRSQTKPSVSVLFPTTSTDWVMSISGVALFFVILESFFCYIYRKCLYIPTAIKKSNPLTKRRKKPSNKPIQSFHLGRMSQCSQAVRLHVFQRSGFRGRPGGGGIFGGIPLIGYFQNLALLLLVWSNVTNPSFDII